MKKLNIDGLKTMILHIMIPALFAIVVLGGINMVYSRNLHNSGIEQRETALESTVDMMNHTVERATSGTKALVLEDDMLWDIYMKESGQGFNDADNHQIATIIQKYKAVSEYVADLTVVDRENMYVLSENGASFFYTQFKTTKQYAYYPVTFWEELTVPEDSYTVLSATYKYGINKIVLPVVFRGHKDRDLVIIDLDCAVIQREILNNSDQKVTDLYLYDTEAGRAIGSNEADPIVEVFEEQGFIEKLDEQMPFSYEINGENRLILSAGKDQMLFGKFLFVTTVPMQYVLRQYNFLKSITLLGCGLCILLLLFLTAYFTKRFYKPLKWMVQRVGMKNGDSEKVGYTGGSELDYLKTNIDRMLQQNKTYEMQLSTAMPLACDRYFEKFLKSQDLTMVDEFEEFLQKSNIRFEHRYFAIASVKFVFTDTFYRQFSSIEHKNVRDGILELLSSVVDANSTLYILPIHDEKYLLIVNLENDTEAFNQIVERIHRVAQSFDNDIEFIRIEISFGEPHKDYIGMRRSYNECLNGSHKISDKSSVWVSRNQGKEYKYNINDENKLFNMMVKGDGQSVEQMVQDVVNKSIDAGIGYQELRDLYLQIYNTAQKVITTKNITDKVLMGEEYINVHESVELMDNDDLFAYIRLLVREATVYNNAPDSKLNLEAITDYINQNYAEDIYLELLAEKFGTSVKYLSRILKNYFGVSYIEYLGRVRVEHAKEFLQTTNLPVNEIMQKCGFNSRNTFIRAFKKYVGIVPSEYRNIYGNKQEDGETDDKS